MSVVNEKQYESLEELTRPHVESYNYMLLEGLHKVVAELDPVEFETPDGQRCSMFINDLNIWSAQLPLKNLSRTNEVYPTECRQRHSTYHGDVNVQLGWMMDGKHQGFLDRTVGQIPIMVKSKACHLHKMSPKELIEHGEEAEEMGGYYIINGQEKIVRMLVLPRRNYPLSLKRPSFQTRGENFSEYALTIRCVRPDESAAPMTLHYVLTGEVKVSFSYNKQMYYVPLFMILKGLLDITDQEINLQIIEGIEDNSLMNEGLTKMMNEMVGKQLFTQHDMLQYMGERFRIKLNLPEWYTPVQVGEYLLRKCICVHLETNRDKFNMLVYMTRKLMSFANKECSEESADNPENQELLLSGHLMLMVLKEKLEGWLNSLKNVIIKDMKKRTVELDKDTIQKAFKFAPTVTRPLEYLLATGNLISPTGLGLMQTSGLSVIADRLNFFRFLSHFRSVHRGSFFTQMRTSEVRKLPSETWGFICPAHTPDGAPCGLLNHLSAVCQAVNTVFPTKPVVDLLDRMGVLAHPVLLPFKPDKCLEVLLDGCPLGYLPDHLVDSVVKYLRHCKVNNLLQIPPVLEICLVRKKTLAIQYPGLYLFSTPARMMRPVICLQEKNHPIEWIGSFEQAYIDIAVCPEDIIPGTTTHMEISGDSILSVLASLTPMSSYNPSPRNIYQCQMAKQTMGSPVHAYGHRADNKLYRLITPQKPIVRPKAQDKYHIDEYPIGTNATVTVISTTGYDMEDAIVINKASFERGFAHGCVYKSVVINLPVILRSESSAHSVVFGCESVIEGLDSDGLPPVGQLLTCGCPLYSYIDLSTGRAKVEKYSGSEEAYVDQVKIVGSESGQEPLNHACLIIRIVRNPSIGDKFSSRHGQKGVCSMLRPQENLPFLESGVVADICFNPHGFPSRMTVGMMIEIMAGKSAAMHGICHDATTFSFKEADSSVEFFAECLRIAGFNSLGTEFMYKGMSGEPLEVQVFTGVVYYQRLRHMVSDKFQVRTTGPMDPLTMQPIQGRKRMGGIRFGEMERDGLVSHGSNFLLHDRLFHNSDRCLSYLCKQCGILLSTSKEKAPPSTAAVSFEAKRKWQCLTCGRSDTVTIAAMPYVFRYLQSELSSMGVKTQLKVE